jgi:hypothetical protein
MFASRFTLRMPAQSSRGSGSGSLVLVINRNLDAPWSDAGRNRAAPPVELRNSGLATFARAPLAPLLNDLERGGGVLRAANLAVWEKDEELIAVWLDGRNKACVCAGGGGFVCRLAHVCNL